MLFSDGKKRLVEVFRLRLVLVAGGNDKILLVGGVEAVVLDDEGDVVEDHHDAEDKFDDVDLDVDSEDGLESHLAEGEQSSGEVQDDVGD